MELKLEESQMEKIHNAIAVRFSQHKYKLFNSYIFNWESDFFSITSDGKYIYEVEVKLSRSDFKKDFTKYAKHNYLTSAKKGDIDFVNKTPNRFYYCCPEGMIKKEELPEYAGLIYLSGDFTSARQVKTAPIIHKNNNSDKYLRTLVDKFYFQFVKMRGEYLYAKRHGRKIDDIQRENSRLLTLIDIKADAGYIAEINRLKDLIKKNESKIGSLALQVNNHYKVQIGLERREKEVKELTDKIYELQAEIYKLKTNTPNE
jgi:hypothetical protein